MEKNTGEAKTKMDISAALKNNWEVTLDKYSIILPPDDKVFLDFRVGGKMMLKMEKRMSSRSKLRVRKIL